MTSYNRENLKLNNLKTSNTSTDQNCNFVIQTKSIILPDSSMISWWGPLPSLELLIKWRAVRDSVEH